jgi:hypothetical protein
VQHEPQVIAMQGLKAPGDADEVAHLTKNIRTS